MLSLAVEKRGAKPLDILRKSGFVPAVLYGPKEAATALSINARAFERIWREAGETTIVKLSGLGEDKETLIYDVQLHPVTDVPLHADFYALEKGKKVEINVPLEFEGQAPAERLGHIVVKALHEIEIEVLPAELPHHITVDISKLENVGDHITASQIALPPSARLLTDADEIVVSITEFVEEKEPEVAAPAPAEGAVPAAEGAAASEGATPAPGEKTESKGA